MTLFGLKFQNIFFDPKKIFLYLLIILLILTPFYPSFASKYYSTNEYDFKRDEIDESSILASYSDNDNTTLINEDAPILESNDSFLSVNTILDDERDLTGTNEIVDYQVVSGDNISIIAYKFKVSNNSIYWANNFTKNHIIRPGDIIKIPPVSGLIHKINKGDTVASLAKKYKVEKEDILKQNLLLASDSLNSGEVLVIPGAVKEIKKPVYKKPTINSTGYSFARYASSSYVSPGGSYKLVWRKPQHTFYWGNCTWYVGQYKNVNWGGNANQWLRNARAKGHPTGNKPTLGSIIVFDGRGYNPRYGHVGIVMDIKADHIIVSDMNYRRLNEITYRKIPKNARSIKGYIYVD